MDLKSRKEIIEEFKKNKELRVKKKALLCVLPMLSLSYNPSFGEWGDSLIDVNICDKEINIILVFDNKHEDDDFAELIHKVMMNSDYIDSDYIDEETVIKCNFKVPKEYVEDFYRFTNGEYSQFSNKYKEKLMKLYTKERSSTPDTYLWMDALEPLDEHKKYIKDKYGFGGHWSEIKEVWSAPKIEHERFYSLKELNDIYNKLKEIDKAG